MESFNVYTEKTDSRQSPAFKFFLSVVAVKLHSMTQASQRQLSAAICQGDGTLLEINVESQPSVDLRDHVQKLSVSLLELKARLNDALTREISAGQAEGNKKIKVQESFDDEQAFEDE